MKIVHHDLASSPESWVLSRRTVHVLAAQFDLLADAVEHLSQALSDDEHERASRFYFEKDRRDYVAGRGLLREVLGRCLGARPRDLAFSYSEHGKPRLLDAVSVTFNVAHTKRRIVIAVGHEISLGIDVEEVHALPDAASIADRYMCPREAEVLMRLEEPERSRAFLRIWTLKEAWLKAKGLGIFHGLSAFDCGWKPAPGGPLLVAGVSLRPLWIGEGALGALAWTTPATEVWQGREEVAA